MENALKRPRTQAHRRGAFWRVRRRSAGTYSTGSRPREYDQAYVKKLMSAIAQLFLGSLPTALRRGRRPPQRVQCLHRRLGDAQAFFALTRPRYKPAESHRIPLDREWSVHRQRAAPRPDDACRLFRSATMRRTNSQGSIGHKNVLAHRSCGTPGDFECVVASRCAAGDHELVLGRVVDGGLLNGGAPPLHYRDTGDLDGSSRLFPEAF